MATRRESYNCGIIVSDALLCDDMFFQVMECIQQSNTTHTSIIICDWICEKGSSTHFNLPRFITLDA